MVPFSPLFKLSKLPFVTVYSHLKRILCQNVVYCRKVNSNQAVDATITTTTAQGANKSFQQRVCVCCLLLLHDSVSVKSASLIFMRLRR